MKLKCTYMGRSYDASTSFPALLDLPDDASVDTALAAIDQALSDKQPLTGSFLVVLSENISARLHATTTQAWWRPTSWS